MCMDFLFFSTRFSPSQVNPKTEHLTETMQLYTLPVATVTVLCAQPRSFFRRQSEFCEHHWCPMWGSDKKEHFTHGARKKLPEPTTQHIGLGSPLHGELFFQKQTLHEEVAEIDAACASCSCCTLERHGFGACAVRL